MQSLFLFSHGIFHLFFLFSTTTLAHWSLFFLFTLVVFLSLCSCGYLLPYPCPRSLAWYTLGRVSSLLMLLLQSFFSLFCFIFPITHNFPFHLPWILSLLYLNSSPSLLPCTQLSLVIQILLPSQCLTQQLFLVHINLFPLCPPWNPPPPCMSSVRAVGNTTKTTWLLEWKTRVGISEQGTAWHRRYLFPIQRLHRLSAYTSLCYFCTSTIKESKQENVDLSRLTLLTVKTWVWPPAWLEPQEDAKSLKNTFQTFSSQYFLICLVFGWEPAFCLPLTTTKEILKNLKHSSGIWKLIPLRHFLSLRNSLFPFSIHFSTFWASPETSQSAEEKWRRIAYFQDSIFFTPAMTQRTASEDDASKDTT